MGARIHVLAGGLSQIREVEGGGSYLSQSDLRAVFGFGKATRAETVEVTWPSGQRQVFHNVEADKFYQIEEGRDQLGLQRFVRQVPATPVAPKAPPLGPLIGLLAKWSRVNHPTDIRCSNWIGSIRIRPTWPNDTDPVICE